MRFVNNKKNIEYHEMYGSNGNNGNNEKSGVTLRLLSLHGKVTNILMSKSC